MKYIKVAAVTAAIALAATACGGDGKDGDAGDGKDPAQLKVWMMGDGTPEQTKFLDGVEAEFKQKHPNTDVQVKYVPWPQVATTFQKAAAAVRAPTSPSSATPTSSPTSSRAAWPTSPTSSRGGRTARR
ncbi:hypothetical protein ACFQY7_54955 [Actinomadura luteofluorescens]|uniref:hypothetical protein n=1 Tax=Actinomadura luteofluorescens TaxID=46163 RepID=UPI0036355E88